MESIKRYCELANGGNIEELFTVKNRLDGAHPELEDLTLRMAQVASILVVPHALVVPDNDSPDQTPLLLVKRLDTGDCEVDTLRLIMDEEEYRSNGSYEQISEIIDNHSTIAKLDVLNFWEQVAFAWVAGCNEMGHLNFAMYQPHRGIYSLTPAFDLVATSILDNSPTDELALSINRKRRNITRQDFEVAMKGSGIKDKMINSIFARFIAAQESWHSLIESSYIDSELKLRYREFIDRNIEAIK